MFPKFSMPSHLPRCPPAYDLIIFHFHCILLENSVPALTFCQSSTQHNFAFSSGVLCHKPLPNYQIKWIVFRHCLSATLS